MSRPAAITSTLCGCVPELADGLHGHHVRLAGARAHAEQRQQPCLLELVVQLELLAGQPVQAAEVDVVAAGLAGMPASRRG